MNKVLIIAEAGVNHNGDISLAKKLVDVAAKSGADYVKFQTFISENLVSKTAKKAKYQNKDNDSNESQFEMLKKLELSHRDHQNLISYCKLKNISFFSTAFDTESLIYLSEIGLKIVKIPSGEITNLPFLRKAAQLFEEVIISTGMSTMKDIQEAFDVFVNNGISKSKISILHCNTEYPTPMKDVNLLAMLAIKKKFKTSVGYSDHTMGIEVPIAAVALGATIIEKHITLDRKMSGPDHLSSLEPIELNKMVESIRNIELAISGNGFKEPSDSEINNLKIVRKSLVAKRKIKSGDMFSEFNITAKRSSNEGISPMRWDEVIGQVANKVFNEDDLIDLKK